ncbi:helix-turn-helix domain-containing protein [Mycolicibacter sp. MYC123]|uniref:Helix-turn-helix domain-containing protein n=1 Tax=[Mycobacterium] zoologicum TaxID=2872311 RepID=A0ABU5YHQ8_9MYCO|nr:MULTISPECIES: helix-turn-helix domain-containing protein [unclassified Mycolicibacter]MEB3048293.1 helix-turn-helix domain-containing protein [Mycolicibacter sp. MYC123]MEB3065021.1 helix-turn-helix domain-containing protein [Mycolicibacter sp. MYC101]
MPESAIERELAEALGRTLAELRQERGLTQEVVAQAAGISRKSDRSTTRAGHSCSTRSRPSR